MFKVQVHLNFLVLTGGDTVGKEYTYFAPKSINSWVQNAISSLTEIIKEYNLDGIDIDYEHFRKDPNTFAECIGQLIMNLKKNRIISFASIAPFDDEPVKTHYLALWRRYGHLIDYVNFQFYAYDKIDVNEFIGFYNQQASNYGGGQILASFGIDEGQGLGPDNGFFEACKELMSQQKLGGIFVWCADESLKHGFIYEKRAQNLLASSS